MNYIKIYNQLIEKRQNNRLYKDKNNIGAVESHHIIPLCLNGSNEHTNIVNLTPREHYICHLLLWKIHSNHVGLNFALMSMTKNLNTTNQRNFKYNSKLYEKARLELSKKMCLMPPPLKNKKLAFNTKTQSIEYVNVNDFTLPYIIQVKMIWICNDSTNEEKQIPNLIDIPNGWHKGRKINNKTSHRGCIMISNPQTFEVKYVPKNTPLPDGWKYGKSRPTNMIKRKKYFEIQKHLYQVKAIELFDYFITHDLSFDELVLKFPELKQYKSSNNILQLFNRYLPKELNAKYKINELKKQLKTNSIIPFKGSWKNTEHIGHKNNGKLHQIKYAVIGKFDSNTTNK